MCQYGKLAQEFCRKWRMTASIVVKGVELLDINLYIYIHLYTFICIHLYTFLVYYL